MRTPQELIAYAKANAGKLSFSSSGVGNPQQLAGELMNMMAGTNVLHVPYRGAAPAVTDVATGAVTMSFTSLAAAQGLMQAGKIRAVAVTSLERMPQLPDVAPLQDGAPGLKGYELLNWFGLFTTGGTPRRHGGPAQRAHGQGAGRTEDRGDARQRRASWRARPPPRSSRLSSRSESRKFAGIIEKAKIKLEN